ncbi:MAG: hypothetical protein ABH877_04005 [bacterium]
MTGRTPYTDYPPTSEGDIAIFLSTDIGRDYAEIGYVAVEMGSQPEKVRDLLKEEAAKLGADAIVNFETGVVVRLVADVFSEGVVCAKGIAVKYK